MPLKPQSRSFSTDLPAFTPILLRIESPVEAVKDDRDPDKQLVLFRFRVLTPPWSEKDHQERQRHGNTVNPKSDGTASLLAQLVNATQPADLSKAELLDFDLETLPGKVVEAIGQVKESDRGRFWNVVTYRRPMATTTAPAPAGDDGWQYTADRQHRWKPGMASWEPTPQATPPPPTPAAPPPPPPPATTPPAPPEITF
jgi:hypothetical protein